MKLAKNQIATLTMGVLFALVVKFLQYNCLDTSWNPGDPAFHFKIIKLGLAMFGQ